MKRKIIVGLALVLVIAPCLAGKAADTNLVIEKRIIFKWPDGQTMREETYRVDAKGKAVRHGPVTEYFESGRKRLEVEYVDGKRNGLLTEYDYLDPDRIVRQGAFTNDWETGTWTWWGATNKKIEECTYKDGKIVGKKNYWRMDGQLAREDSYNEAGELIQVTKWYYFESPDKHTMETQGTFKRGQKDGKWTYWNQDGTIKAEGEWKNGKPWNGICGVPVPGDAGSWGGLETFSRYSKGKKVETK